MNILKKITANRWLTLSLQAATPSLLVISISYLIMFLLNFSSTYLPITTINKKTLFYYLGFALNIINVIAFFWFVFRGLKILQIEIKNWLRIHPYPNLRILWPMLHKSVQAAIMLLMANILIPALNLSTTQTEVASKFANILLIGVLGWIFIQVINGVEKLILHRYSENNNSTINARKVRTQIQILKKIVLTLGLIIMLAATLMTFDSVRKLGTGLLTTAGILSALSAVASQQSLSRLAAGLQIAFTQPIRIGDIVIIENEQGEIEEISLSHVVVKIWDLRRLVLPTNYFMEKNFQNLTRTSTQLLGTVFLYVDHLFPIPALREELDKVLKASKWWDQQTGSLNVTNMKETSTEIRVLLSAQNNNDLTNLRYEVREQLINFIAKNYTDYFPQQRTLSRKV